MPSEIERNLWSSISTVKALISKTVEAYGLPNLTEDEVRHSPYICLQNYNLYIHPPFLVKPETHSLGKEKLSSYISCSNQIQWNLDLTKSLGTGQICSLNGGFVISRFFSIHFTVTLAGT